MKRRNLLAGLVTASIGATAGCAGVLGGGNDGGGCSVPEDQNGIEMLPESGNGFELLNTQSKPMPEDDPLERMSFGRYSKGEAVFVSTVLEAPNVSAAEQVQNERAGKGDTIYVQKGKYVFTATALSGANRSTLESLLGRSALGSDCVESDSRTLQP